MGRPPARQPPRRRAVVGAADPGRPDPGTTSATRSTATNWGPIRSAPGIGRRRPRARRSPNPARCRGHRPSLLRERGKPWEVHAAEVVCEHVHTELHAAPAVMAPVGSVASRRLTAAAVAALDPDRPPLTPQPPSTGDATTGPSHGLSRSRARPSLRITPGGPGQPTARSQVTATPCSPCVPYGSTISASPVACLPSDDASGAAE